MIMKSIESCKFQVVCEESAGSKQEARDRAATKAIVKKQGCPTECPEDDDLSNAQKPICGSDGNVYRSVADFLDAAAPVQLLIIS